jgi:site-specific DNA recombinase
VRKAGLYLRISKDLTGEGMAVDRQRTDGTRLLTGRGWELYREYVDNDVSASGRRKRPAFEEMLRDIVAGKISVVVSLSLDRLTRNRRDQLRLVETCQRHGILVALVRGSDIDMSSAVGRAMADMMAVWARMEIEQKSERHISQIAQAAEQGRIVGGRRAFGYTPDGKHLDPDEAPLVREMYDLWLTGSPLASIRRWLQQQGSTTPRGNPWHNQSVREVLANPRNAALRGMRDRVHPGTDNHTRSQWHRIIGPAQWPAIVSEEVWRATMARILDPRRPGSHHGVYSSKHLLTGIAVCGVCEAAGMQDVRMVAGRRDGAALLRCPSYAHLGRRSSYIEAWVENAVIDRFLSEEGRQLLAAATHATSEESPVDLDELRSLSIKLRARLRTLSMMLSDGEIDREEYRFSRDRVQAQMGELDAQIGAAGQVNVIAGLLAAEDVEEEWDSYYTADGRDRQREIIRQIMTVTILPGSSGRPGGERFDPSSVRIVWRTSAGQGTA